jgi:hypothetical protein
VRYSSEMLQHLIEPLKSKELPPVDRLGVQGDVFALFKAGLLPAAQVRLYSLFFFFFFCVCG